MANAQPKYQECFDCSESQIAIDTAVCPKCGGRNLRAISMPTIPMPFRTFDALSEEEQSEVLMGMNLVAGEILSFLKSQGTPPRVAMIAASLYAEMAKSIEDGSGIDQDAMRKHVVMLWDRYVAPLDLRVKGGHA
jgi:hypothetical protein